MSADGVGSPYRVGLVQFKPRKADVAANLERVVAAVDASARKHDILVFPEATLSGYFLEGGVQEVALAASEVAERLGEPPAGSPDVVIGFFERWRGRLYNAAAYFQPAGDRFEAAHVHRKLFLPTYGVFDEDRFVEGGTELRAFSTRFGRVGLLVCEDAWHSLTGSILAVSGAELILIVSATPLRGMEPSNGRPTNLERWETIIRVMAMEHGVHVGVSHLVGSEGGKLFAGDSLMVSPAGDVVARAEIFEEGVTEVLVDPFEVARTRSESPLLADLEKILPHLQDSLDRALDEGREIQAPTVDTGNGARRMAGGGMRHSNGPDPDDASVLEIDPALTERILVEFLRDELRDRRGFEKAVIGVSGGVDSAVSLYLAARALGPENVFGLRMPYRTSSPDSLEHAMVALSACGASERTIDITGSVDAYVEEHEPDLSPLRRGNVCARMRAVTLFDQSAKLGALPIGTGNKSERLLGYYTWHADDSPPVNPLGDLFKTQVWTLARHLGVPSAIVDKPASADLVRGVDDEDELGISYPKADLILHWLLRGYLPHRLVDRGFPESDVETVWRRLSGTHWKRRLPTVAMLSSTAIGEFYLRPVDY